LNLIDFYAVVPYGCGPDAPISTGCPEIERMTNSNTAESLILDFMPDLIRLRRKLHAKPELSDNEGKTARVVTEFFRQFGPDEVIAPLGSNGMAFLFDSGRPGPTVVFRCELDAIPVEEQNDFAYRSRISAVSHKCGHDGHMAIMAGFGHLVAHNRPKQGQIILLFQPAEETGQGAMAVVNDPKFKSLNVDYAFALHNLPGYPLGTILLKSGTINCASRGMIIRLIGVTSHSAWPEHGLSPAEPMCELIQDLARLPSTSALNRFYCKVTVGHARLGDPAFGLSPGYAELMATLRSETDGAMSILVEHAVGLVKEKATLANLSYEINWAEEFVASSNDPGACDIVEQAGQAAGANVMYLEEAMPVSEDFGQFSARIPGVMFGLGAGETCPGLHQADYDFPEELIGIGSRIFMEIAKILVY
jgi:amidohydrolase